MSSLSWLWANQSHLTSDQADALMDDLDRLFGRFRVMVRVGVGFDALIDELDRLFGRSLRVGQYWGLEVQGPALDACRVIDREDVKLSIH